jgi:hypothetical protein
MTVAPFPEKPARVPLRYFGEGRTTNRTRSSDLAKEYYQLVGELTAEAMAARRGASLSTIERQLVVAYAGACMAIGKLTRRMVGNQPVDLKTYDKLCGSMVRIARQLGLNERTTRTARIAGNKAAAGGAVSLADYLAGKSDASAGAVKNTAPAEIDDEVADVD